MARMTRAAAPVVGIALLVALTACGNKQVEVSGQKAPATGPSATGSATTPAASGSADPAAGGFVFPDLPPIVVPDVTSFTDRSQKYAEKLGDLTAPGAGVLATGARCDTKGRVVNTPSLTEVDNGDGSGVYTDQGKTVTNNGNGSGDYVDATKTITINGDGSGSYVDGERTISINKDGSGDYVDAGKTVTVNADGSGTYVDGDRTITVNADGSGDYVDGDRTITVNPDGSGDYVDAEFTITNNGDGTGTVNGQDAKLEPFPLFAKVGKFPPVKKLKPLGKSCGTLIRLDARVLFDFDKDTLRPEAGPVLDKVATALKGVGTAIQVNGHTDAKGSDSYNLDLSQRRATTVADALAERGVKADLKPKGFGETQPIAANELGGKDNPGGRALNRRVELVIPG
jgi:OmpA-OmpF porin, OOP family